MHNATGMIRRIARAAPLSAKQMAAHLRLSRSEVFAELASVPHAPTAVTVRDVRWRHIVAKDPDCSPDVLARLATDSDALVRGAVALNPAIPQPVLNRLCRDSFFSVRVAAAANRSCSAASLRRLAVDPHHDVRISAALNESCPPGALRRLAADPEMSVRVAAESNPGCDRRLSEADSRTRRDAEADTPSELDVRNVVTPRFYSVELVRGLPERTMP